LVLGIAYWGYGEGAGPWFLANYDSGVLAGGTNPGDPGWGQWAEPGVQNIANPSLAVPFAVGFLKSGAAEWALRMADAQSADGITTAYAGGLPLELDQQGGIILGGDGESNNSEGTLFEAALVAGFPSDDTDLRVLQNIQAAGYGDGN
jgi:hypothetical protein